MVYARLPRQRRPKSSLLSSRSRGIAIEERVCASIHPHEAMPARPVLCGVHPATSMEQTRRGDWSRRSPAVEALSIFQWEGCLFGCLMPPHGRPCTNTTAALFPVSDLHSLLVWRLLASSCSCSRLSPEFNGLVLPEGSYHSEGCRSRVRDQVLFRGCAYAEPALLNERLGRWAF